MQCGTQRYFAKFVTRRVCFSFHERPTHNFSYGRASLRFPLVCEGKALDKCKKGYRLGYIANVSARPRRGGGRVLQSKNLYHRLYNNYGILSNKGLWRIVKLV